MAEGKDSKLVLFASIAVLAIPAVVYVMGYVYWTSYFSHFGVDLAKVDLPVYKIMAGATPAVYAVILATLLIYIVGKWINRTKEGYQVPFTDVALALGLIFAATAIIVLRRIDSYWMWVVLGVGIALLFYAVGVRLEYRSPRPERVPYWVGRYIGAGLIVLAPIASFFLLRAWSEDRAQREADELLERPYQKCRFVTFHFEFDGGSCLPDSLVLIASSESHYFVFSRKETTLEKPDVYAIKKDAVSFMEIH